MRFALIFAAICCLFACRNSSNPSGLKAEGSQLVSNDVPSDFLEFYNRFHTDSFYQIEHILWPLSGETSHTIGDSAQTPQVDFEWQREMWIMHKPISDPNGFTREFSMLDSTFIIEKIKTKGNNYGLERRFVKYHSGEWVLIYYSDMHEMK